MGPYSLNGVLITLMGPYSLNGVLIILMSSYITLMDPYNLTQFPM